MLSQVCFSVASETRSQSAAKLLLPDKFLYVFKTGPSRARKRAATAGRDACLPLRFAPLRCAPGASLGLARTCQRVPVEDSRPRHQRSDTPAGASLAERPATHLRLLAHARVRRWVPHRPDSNHGRDRCGTARVKGKSLRSTRKLDP